MKSMKNFKESLEAKLNEFWMFEKMFEFILTPNWKKTIRGHSNPKSGDNKRTFFFFKITDHSFLLLFQKLLSFHFPKFVKLFLQLKWSELNDLLFWKRKLSFYKKNLLTKKVSSAPECLNRVDGKWSCKDHDICELVSHL